MNHKAVFIQSQPLFGVGENSGRFTNRESAGHDQFSGFQNNSGVNRSTEFSGYHHFEDGRNNCEQFQRVKHVGHGYPPDVKNDNVRYPINGFSENHNFPNLRNNVELIENLRGNQHFHDVGQKTGPVGEAECFGLNHASRSSSSYEIPSSYEQ